MTCRKFHRERYREGCIPVLETERLILRAPRLEDAKAVAALANDKRIAENTRAFRIPIRAPTPKTSSPPPTSATRRCSW